MNIHPTAVIGERTNIADDVRIGPYAVIEDDVKIGAGCELGSHSVIKRFTTMGARNRIFEHAVLGGEPQDVKYNGEQSGLVIGDDNLIREYVTMHRASGEGEQTRVGSRNFIMIGVHIAHNCEVGDDNIFANETALAGHIVVQDHVFLSNNVGCHQFVRLGKYAMIGGKSKIVQDVLPYFVTDGNPARVRGVNTVGLKRAGFSTEDRRQVRRAYKILLGPEEGELATRLNELDAIDNEHVRHLVEFVRGSKRGFTRNRTSSGNEIEDDESE